MLVVGFILWIKFFPSEIVSKLVVESLGLWKKNIIKSFDLIFYIFLLEMFEKKKIKFSEIEKRFCMVTKENQFLSLCCSERGLCVYQNYEFLKIVKIKSFDQKIIFLYRTTIGVYASKKYLEKSNAIDYLKYVTFKGKKS